MVSVQENAFNVTIVCSEYIFYGDNLMFSCKLQQLWLFLLPHGIATCRAVGCRQARTQDWLQAGTDPGLATGRHVPRIGYRQARTQDWLQAGTYPGLATGRHGPRIGYRQARTQDWLQAGTDPGLATGRHVSRIGYRQARIQDWLQAGTDPGLATGRLGPRIWPRERGAGCGRNIFNHDFFNATLILPTLNIILFYLL